VNHMKLLAVMTIFAFSLSQALAAVPASIATSLAARHAALGSVSLSYSVDEAQQWPSRTVSDSEVAQIGNAVKGSLVAQGVKDRTEIANDQAAVVAATRKDAKGGHKNFSSKLLVDIDATGGVLVSMTSIIDGYSSSAATRFGTGYVLVGSGPPSVPAGKPGRNTEQSGIVLSVVGNGMQEVTPFTNQIHINPEDMMMLTAQNPVSTYGGAWSVVTSNRDALVMRNTISSGEMKGYVVTVSLARRFGFAPETVVVDGPTQPDDGEIMYKVADYKNWHGVWLPGDFTRSENDGPGEYADTMHFRLTSLSAFEGAAPFPENVAKVTDYRLLGSGLESQDMREARVIYDQRVVRYTWDGALPTKQQLKQMSDHKQYAPGEGGPDPKQDGALVVGGLALVGVGLRRNTGKPERKIAGQAPNVSDQDSRLI